MLPVPKITDSPTFLDQMPKQIKTNNPTQLTQKEVNAEIEKLGDPQPNDEKLKKQLTEIRMGKPRQLLKSKRGALQFIISYIEKYIALIDKGDALVQANK